jgi:hypothetical protein
MTALEFIGIAQARVAQNKLGEVRELLLRPNPVALESCHSLLGEVACIMEELIAADSVKNNAGNNSERTPEFYNSVREIQQAAGELQVQIQHGTRFCLGWLQTRLGVGYTDQGTPVMLGSMLGSGPGSMPGLPGAGQGRSFEL